jgi:ribose-phosphate pyrophosphokinase
MVSEQGNIMAPMLFRTESYAYMTPSISDPEIISGKLERKQFPDGERYLRIDEQVDGRHVVILGGTISDSDTLEIFDLACAAVKYGAKELTLLIPYFGYSTMERASKPGEVVPAKTRARLLSCIPKAHKGNNIILLDLHSLGIPHYFEGDVRTKHVYAKHSVISLILQAARPHDGQFVLGSTDAGRAKWVESLAKELNVDAAFCYKRRSSGKDTEIIGVNADVKDKYVVIYDDMIRTGSSIVNAATAYMNAGATGIGIVTTHGLFVDDSLDRLGGKRSVGCTNSHPNFVRLKKAYPHLTCRTSVEDVSGILFSSI